MSVEPSGPPLKPIAMSHPHPDIPVDEGGPAPIRIRGARQNNLKNLDLDIPTGELVVVTGVSGSGKSSLVFDTLYAEGQRRYVETFSAYARQFLDRMDRPAVDRIEGVPPAIAIDQTNPVRTSRSTVGTMTEINDHLKLLWARFAGAHCPQGHGPIVAHTAAQVTRALLERAAAAGDPRLVLCFPVAIPDTFTPGEIHDLLQAQGYTRTHGAPYAAYGRQVVDVVQDRLRALQVESGRLQEAVEACLSRPEARLIVHLLPGADGSAVGSAVGSADASAVGPADGSAVGSAGDAPTSWRWSARLRCHACAHEAPAVTPSHFSFNSPLGACEACRGFGRVIGIDWGLVIPDEALSLAQGAIKPWQTESFKECQADLMRYAPVRGIDVHRPWRQLTAPARAWVLDGDPAWRGDWNRQWYGVRRFFTWLESRTYKMHVRVLLSRYRAYTLCSACAGTRLKPEAAHWQIAGKRLHELMLMPLDGLRQWFDTLAGEAAEGAKTRDRVMDNAVAEGLAAEGQGTCDGVADNADPISQKVSTGDHDGVMAATCVGPMLGEQAAQLLLEIRTRLGFLCDVGLGYLTLDRQSRTLSGGEVQRINLTTALGTSLVNTLFVLDEPSIGLHPHDMQRIIEVMHRLRDAGNSLVVVEHDPAVMWAADRVIDLGPGPGERGGSVLYAGAPEGLAAADTLTGAYLAQRLRVDTSRRAPRPVQQATPKLLIEGARENNLKNVSLSIPLERFVCLTGVSGSGKSTLMQGIVLPALLKAKGRPSEAPGAHDRLLGEDWIDNVVHVDQSPIGKTSRSNPVSYVGAFDAIRKRFAALEQAQERHYSAGTFSFNSGNGRCPTCAGSGFEHIEMQFLSDVYLRCPDCDGRRYRPEILEVKERGQSIADVLAMTVAEALLFYADDAEVGTRLRPLRDVGLEYLRLGQAVPTLSGGEAQRLKLAGFLAEAAATARKPRRSSTVGRPAGTLFLFDEPTTGLHFEDIRRLLDAFRQLLDAGHSLLVIEHNLDVIAACDWVIDLGPGAGERGGEVVACAAPEDLRAHPTSRTGQALRAYTHAATAQARPARSAAEPQQASAVADLRALAGASIVVHRAREHNLKELDVRIPRHRMTVITGPSGSGKSTLAFDVIFGEGQRRYLESLNAYARQFVQPASKPDVEGVYGIPPTVAIEQRTSRGGQKSTVATLTEIHHFLRLLWVRLGTPHCPRCGIPVEAQDFASIAARILRDYRGKLTGLLAPLVRARKGIYRDLARWASGKGYTHLRVDGRFVSLQPFPKLDRYQEHAIELPVASLRIGPDREEALRAALAQCLELGKGSVMVLEDLDAAGTDATLLADRPTRLFSTLRACSACGLSLPDPDPRLFSFNSRIGWCEDCQGTGLHLSEALRSQLRDSERFGAQSEESLTRSETLVDSVDATAACRSCLGQRLNPMARAVRFGGCGLGELGARSVDAAAHWFATLVLPARSLEIARDLLAEVRARLRFLHDVGLGYLALNRPAPSLSGGEAQRIRLAAQLGSNLQGVCYVLDEPSIGLHPRDNRVLVDTLRALRDRGNTLLVVEHDEETIRRADHLIDIGPGAGRLGGTVIAQGHPQEVLAHPASLTGRFLREPLRHPMRPRRHTGCDQPCIELRGVAMHNLKAVDVHIPLGRLTVVTGVSGSGKSTLARGVLLPLAAQHLGRTRTRSAPIALGTGVVREARGLAALERVLEVDQTPIGKTPRSCPATYIGFWDAIRRLFADTQEARIRGWDASRFSFNTGQGRCAVCEGQGMQTVEMSFLPDVKVVCEACRGARFNAATLEVRWQGLNVGALLQLSVDEALAYMAAHPSVHRALQLMQDVGLGYLTLGQPSPTLSGGEAQRIKLVAELAKARGRDAPRTLYVLDEPTVGLHMADVEKLITVFHRLVDAGHTLVVVEHDMDLWAEADWLIDLGPEGGDAGGRVTIEGPPEMVASHPGHTGRLLGAFLAQRAVQDGSEGAERQPRC